MTPMPSIVDVIRPRWAARMLAVSAVALAATAGPDVAPTGGPASCLRADDRLEALARRAVGMTGLPKITVDDPIDGSVYPPDFAPPTFVWHDADPSADAWIVEVAAGAGSDPIVLLADGTPPVRGEIDPRCVAPTNALYEPTPYQASARTWKPCREAWEAIRRVSTGRPAIVSFLGYRRSDPSRVVSAGRVTISTSADRVGAPVFYRDVPLMPSQGKDGVIKPLDQTAQPLIQWRLKDLSREGSKVLLENMPTCANCHSFSADGRTLGMDVDGPDGDKGAYAIADVAKDVVIDNAQIMTWNDFPGKPEGHLTLGFLARVSPDGRYVVATVNEALYVRNYTDWKILQTFYPTRGILAVYDRKTGDIRALPGADDPAYVHCDAVWAPDGKSLVFARAAARDPYSRTRPAATYAGDPNETPIQYDLYRIPWNDGHGGKPERIAGASANGSSNSFPKITPDGRWIVWVRARNGQLLRPDGRLWIAPIGGGAPRELRCNTPLMNSWHSFSPNGRWMIFSSKKNTPYTQLFLTHLDAEGRDTPPILVEGTTASNRAANIPEFVAASYEGFDRITVPALAHYEHLKRGNELAHAGQHASAAAEYETALQNSAKWRVTDWRIHENLSKTLLKMGKTDEAMAHIRRSLELNPDNSEMEANLGYILFERGKLAEARSHLDTALKLNPKDPQAWYNRATLRLNLGDREGAVGDYGRALDLDPKMAAALRGRGSARMAGGDLAGAGADLDRAIALDPKDPASWYFRARLKAALGRREEALSDLDRAEAATPPGSPQRQDIAAMRARLAQSPR